LADVEMRSLIVLTTVLQLKELDVALKDADNI